MTHEVSGAAGHGRAGGDPDLTAPAAKTAPPLPAVTLRYRPAARRCLADPDGADGHVPHAGRPAVMPGRVAGGGVRVCGDGMLPDDQRLLVLLERSRIREFRGLPWLTLS